VVGVQVAEEHGRKPESLPKRGVGILLSLAGFTIVFW
jgi:hypothetical protein